MIRMEKIAHGCDNYASVSFPVFRGLREGMILQIAMPEPSPKWSAGSPPQGISPGGSCHYVHFASFESHSGMVFARIYLRF